MTERGHGSLPALVERDPVVVAIGTESTARYSTALEIGIESLMPMLLGRLARRRAAAAANACRKDGTATGLVRFLLLLLPMLDAGRPS